MRNSTVGSFAYKIFRIVNAFAKKSPPRMAVILAVLMYGVTVMVVPTALNINAISTLFLLTMLLSFVSAGQTIVMIGGGLDFTVGAVMSVSAIITTVVMQGQDGLFFRAFVIAIAFGAAVGLLNGVTTSKIGLPALVVTLVIGNVVNRMSYILTGGNPTGNAGRAFVTSVTYRYFGVIPSLTLYALIIFPLMFYILYRSRYGKQLYLTGNNPVAAKLSGINVDRVKIMSYVISGVLSAFTGMLGAGMMHSARNMMFDAYAYNSLIAVVVGGTSFAGGIGTYGGTIAGAAVMVVLNNMLTAMNLSSSIREIALGTVLVFLLAMYNRKKAVRQ